VHLRGHRYRSPRADRYGLIGDIALGLVGSIVGSLVFRALGVSPSAGLIALVVVAFIGAVLVIGAQRMIWARA
jgi:uncharacterized membrane protein YeaQ/YmgE (transglycosylase-associated protein family)